nr:immunoglobulin heavy chain junction region [Mus musculus]
CSRSPFYYYGSTAWFAYW